MGWIGSAMQLYNALSVFRCDITPDGKFCVDGKIASFMDAGEEFVVDDEAVYYVNGKPHRLAAALNATSYGLEVKVIA